MEPLPHSSSAPNAPGAPGPVAQLATRLAARGRLDPASARRLPARSATLLRRTVRALPRRVAAVLAEVAPPPRTGDTTEYADALLALFDAYDSVAPGALLPSVGRLAHALERLTDAATGRPRVPAGALAPLIGDAYEWQAARLTGSHRDLRHELHDGYLALVGEGFVPPGRWAVLAATELAVTHRDRGNPAAAAWYASRGLTWAPGSLDLRLTDALVASVEVLVSIGHHLEAIEHSPRLLDRLEVRGGLRAASAVTLRCALARAHSDLGEHTLAIEHATDALVRARRTWGARALTTQVCDLLFDECFQRAVANR